MGKGQCFNVHFNSLEPFPDVTDYSDYTTDTADTKSRVFKFKANGVFIMSYCYPHYGSVVLLTIEISFLSIQPIIMFTSKNTLFII